MCQKQQSNDTQGAVMHSGLLSKKTRYSDTIFTVRILVFDEE